MEGHARKIIPEECGGTNELTPSGRFILLRSIWLNPHSLLWFAVRERDILAAPKEVWRVIIGADAVALVMIIFRIVSIDPMRVPFVIEAVICYIVNELFDEINVFGASNKDPSHVALGQYATSLVTNIH